MWSLLRDCPQPRSFLNWRIWAADSSSLRFRQTYRRETPCQVMMQWSKIHKWTILRLIRPSRAALDWHRPKVRTKEMLSCSRSSQTRIIEYVTITRTCLLTSRNRNKREHVAMTVTADISASQEATSESVELNIQSTRPGSLGRVQGHLRIWSLIPCSMMERTREWWALWMPHVPCPCQIRRTTRCSSSRRKSRWRCRCNSRYTRWRL